MTRSVHLVGSIALDSTAEVFDTAGAILTPRLKRCPDGETGGRRLWISYQWPVLRATSFREPASDRATPGMGLCTLRLRQNVPQDEIRFPELGYAREARASYQDYLAARHRGVIASTTRFQVCLPTPRAVIHTFVIPQDVERILSAYEARMLRELEQICAAIPHCDLAIQWDVCTEMLQWDGRWPMKPAFAGMEQTFAKAFRALSACVPDDVELGYHFCYGDMDAKHFVEPIDLSKAVSLINLIVASSQRRIDWVHVPVPASREDAAYYAPLEGLKRTPRMEVYLGLVHLEDKIAGTTRRMKAASSFIKDFGIATECGMGRIRRPDLVRRLMEIHAAAADEFDAR